MNKIILIGILSLFCGNIFAQNGKDISEYAPFSEFEKPIIYGKIKSIRTFKYETDSVYNIIESLKRHVEYFNNQTYYLEFDINGNIIDVVFFDRHSENDNDNDTAEHYRYTYDKNIIIEESNNEYRPIIKKIYSNNKRKKIVQQLWYDSIFNVSRKYLYTYNKKNIIESIYKKDSLIQTNEYDKHYRLINGIPNNVWLLASPVSYIYDKKERKTIYEYKIMCSIGDKTIYKDIALYNKKNRVIKYQKFADEKMLRESIFKYKNNKLIEETHFEYHNGNDIEKTFYFYDKNDFLIKKQTLDNNETEPYNKVSITYELDKYGNWVKMFVNDDDYNFCLIERKITYYE